MQQDSESAVPDPSEAPAAPARVVQPNDTVIMDPFDLESLAMMPAVVPVSDPQHAPLAEPEHYAPVDRDALLAETGGAGDAESAEPVKAEPSGEPETPPEPSGEPETPPEPELRHVPAPEPEPTPDAEPLPAEIEQDLPADFDEPVLPEAPAAPTVAEVAFAPVARPDPFPWGVSSAVISDPDELEQTLIVPRRDNGERFVLQFSTGESVTVSGTGLLGRNPSPQPGEYFDQLVSISDPGKSVSKTHLEFGQEAGAFWVSDRFSGNGSVVREPGMAPKRLAPGKRYRIVRGTRVDIGEQFFVVS